MSFLVTACEQLEGVADSEGGCDLPFVRTVTEVALLEMGLGL